MSQIRLRKAVIETISDTSANVKLENGSTFSIPHSFVADDVVYAFDEGDEVFIYVDEITKSSDLPYVIIATPTEEGGLSVSMAGDDQGEHYIINEIKYMTKEEINDLRCEIQGRA
jgi:hypothetical protein